MLNKKKTDTQHEKSGQKHYESRFKNVVKNLLKSTNISHNKYASSVSWRKSRNCIVCMGHTYLGKQLFQSERI